MNTALTALDTIYSEVLVRECTPDVLTTFTQALARIKAEWAHTSQVRALVDSIPRDGYNAWCARLQAANRAANAQYAMGNPHSLEHAEWQRICEADALWEREKAARLAKEAEEARLAAEPARLQKLKDDELMEEARRRIAAAQREQTIQSLVASLTAGLGK